MTFDFDLFVIGGGSGGVRAGRVAAESGAKVALAEEYRMGGTCVIRGCVPKKLMVFASGYSEKMAEAEAYGWDVKKGSFDWSAFWPNLRAELDRLEGIYETNLGRPGTQIFNQRATIRDPHTIELANGQVFTTKHILVATGGTPFKPNIPGIELAGTSNDVFLMETLPKRILIVGGGYIACEFACIFNGLDVETTQFYRGDQILRGFDNEARALIADQIQARGVNLQLGTDVASLEKGDDGILVTTTTGDTATYDAVIYATGRVPNTKNLGLDKVGVQLGKGGEVIVDDFSQTNIPSIYAVGDVTNRINLTPVAIREGQAFVETVFNANPTKVDHSNVASAVFTQPEYGTVGLTEEQAFENGNAEVYSAAFRPMQNSFINKDEKVLFKLVVETDTRKILGCHIIADGAGELIQMVGVLMKMGATKEDFDATIAVHPTMSEEIVLMKTPTRTA